MAIGDVTIYKDGAFSPIGARRYVVAKSATTIKPGEPVAKTVTFVSGANLSTAVSPAVTLSPLSSLPIIGIAAGPGTASTNTATAAGVVDVIPCVSGIIYLCAPKTSTLWDTQAEYDALVGTRVLFDLTSSTYTITTSAGGGGTSVSGLVVEPLDIAKYPGKVAFSVRATSLYTN